MTGHRKVQGGTWWEAGGGVPHEWWEVGGDPYEMGAGNGNRLAGGSSSGCEKWP